MQILSHKQCGGLNQGNRPNFDTTWPNDFEPENIISLQGGFLEFPARAINLSRRRRFPILPPLPFP